MAAWDFGRSEKSITILNNIESSRLPKLISRLSQNVENAGESAFTEEEKEKLSEVFDVKMEDVDALLSFLSNVLKRAAYYNLKPASLLQQLSSAGVESGHGEVISQAWQKYGKDIISKLKKNTLTSHQLEKVDWHLNLQVAQGSKSKITEPNVVFQLQMKDATEKGSDTFLMEFGHEELLQFYNKLEVIQEQLDALS